MLHRFLVASIIGLLVFVLTSYQTSEAGGGPQAYPIPTFQRTSSMQIDLGPDAYVISYGGVTVEMPSYASNRNLLTVSNGPGRVDLVVVDGVILGPILGRDNAVLVFCALYQEAKIRNGNSPATVASNMSPDDCKPTLSKGTSLYLRVTRNHEEGYLSLNQGEGLRLLVIHQEVFRLRMSGVNGIYDPNLSHTGKLQVDTLNHPPLRTRVGVLVRYNDKEGNLTHVVKYEPGLFLDTQSGAQEFDLGKGEFIVGKEADLSRLDNATIDMFVWAVEGGPIVLSTDATTDGNLSLLRIPYRNVTAAPMRATTPTPVGNAPFTAASSSQNRRYLPFIAVNFTTMS